MGDSTGENAEGNGFKTHGLPPWLLICIALVYILLTVGYGIAVACLDDPGKFGDMFGAYNAFFTGLAFLGVIYTIWLQGKQVQMQSEELRLQRKELEANRHELARSANAQERTESALRSQLRAAAISARISAVTQLIGHKIDQIDKQYTNLFGCRVTSLSEKEFEIQMAAYSELLKGSVDQCIGEMNELRNLKRDLELLYRECVKLSDAGEPTT